MNSWGFAGIKFRVILCFLVVFVGQVVSDQAKAQFPTGELANANHPAGAPDPEKLDQIWQVDPITGALNVKIAFNTAPMGGRGPKIPFSLMYNSSSTITLQANGVSVQGSNLNMACFNTSVADSCHLSNSGNSNDADPQQVTANFQWSSRPLITPPGPTGPWTTSGPYMYNAVAIIPNATESLGVSGSEIIKQTGCSVNGPYIYVDENGNAHDMNLNFIFNIQTEADDTGGPCFNPTGTTGLTWDGSAITTGAGSAVYPDGTQYVASPSIGLEDSNGNVSTLTTDSSGRNSFTTTLPIGQVGSIRVGSYTIKTKSATDTDESYTVTFASIPLGTVVMPHPVGLPVGEVQIPPSYCIGFLCPGYIEIGQLPSGSTINGVTSVSLPDSTSYSFEYDPTYGTISQINFPTGGYVRFLYGIRSDVGSAGPFNKVSAIVVTDAYISDGTTGEQHWQYDFPAKVSGSGLTSIITAPDGTTTSYVGAAVNYSKFSESGPDTWKEVSRTIKSASGATIRTVSTVYNSAGTFPQQVATTLYDGGISLQQQDQYTYDSATNSLVTEKDESDFYTCSSGCAPPQSLSASQWLRHTYTTYWSGGPIIDKPSQVLVTDGSNHPYSLVQYGYDEYSVTGAAGFSHHDDAKYGASSTLPRGNLTSESQCAVINTATTVTPASAAGACSSWLKTTHTYDLTGQRLTTTDPKGNITHLSYADAYGSVTPSTATNSYLSLVTHPNGATDSYTYNYYTGVMASHTGWNGAATTTTYSLLDPHSNTPDMLNRIRTITPGSVIDGTTGSTGNGTTTYTYNDTPGAFSVQEQHAVDTNGTTTSIIKNLDGLGRMIGSVTASPQCSSGIKVDTAYDSMSRIESVSNPYCSSSDTTYGLTKFQYDSLGRKIQTMFPDASLAATAYSINTIETTDPFNGTTNVQHIQQSDGLGRLTNVCEVTSTSLGSGSPASCGLNVGGTGYLTSYTYDPLGNMTCVEQHGGVSGTGCSAAVTSDASSSWHVRRFTYDALSRLTSAKNPEAGSAPDVYTYSNSNTSACAGDPGLPCTKTDARGVVTTYTYESMNRVIGKTYGSLPDLSSCYQYDKKLSSVTDSNPWGELTAEWQQPGSCSTTAQTAIPSGAVAVRIPSNHDAMGRVGLDQQCLTAATCSSTVGNFVYTYNLLGSPVQVNDGVRAGTVTATQSNTANATPITAPSITWKTTYDGMAHIASAVVQDQPTSTGTGPVFPASTFLTAPTLLKATNYDPFGHLTAAQMGIPNGSSSPAIATARQYDVRSRISYEFDNGANASSTATHSLGSIVIGGTEQGPTYPASSYATATVTINGVEQDQTFNLCPTNPEGTCYQAVPDVGVVAVTINGTTISTNYGPTGANSTGSGLAGILTVGINGASLPVKATVSGNVITLHATAPGTSGNGIPITTSANTTQTQYYSGPSFSFTNSPATANGVNVAANVYDTGTITATINGHTASASFNNTSTAKSIATALAASIQSMDGSFLNAVADGDVNILVSDGTGTTTDWTVTTSVTYDTADFTSPSFSATSFSMSNGDAADPNQGIIYSYVVPGGGYAPNGNILVHSDSVMGDWYFSYDAVDRLITATPDTNAPAQYLGNYGCWTYDAFGNRTMEAFSTAACTGTPTPMVRTAYNPVNSQISSSTWSSATLTAGSYGYDASGNTLYDGNNRYWYDAEGQLCAEQSQRVGGAPIVQYVYDAEGARIAKGTLASAPATYTSTCSPPLGTGFTLTNRYLVDQSGDQVTEFNGSGVWQHSNVWAGGKLVGTYDTKGLHFDLADPLGTKRVQANAAGQIDETCMSLPFGNDINNPVAANCVQATNSLGTSDDATEHHFTQKERDTETGNDYFLARYYSSALGRFTTPDWSAKEDPVPYAVFDDPQSLNLYAYVRNSPITHLDPNGHEDPLTTLVIGAIESYAAAHPEVVNAIAKAAIDSVGTVEKVAASEAIEQGAEITLSGLGAGLAVAGLVLDAQVGGNPHEDAMMREHNELMREHVPQASSGGARKGNGRGGKQARLRAIEADDKASSADRGWITSEKNQIKSGNRGKIRVPPGKNLAHRRGKEARKGYDYSHSDLQDTDLHERQHRLEKKK